MAAGADLPTPGALLERANILMTMCYVRLVADQKLAAMEKFEKFRAEVRAANHESRNMIGGMRINTVFK
jgi:hypothetical protein